MFPSSTVENYLKTIYLTVNSLTKPQRLLPMGQLAASLGVAPGTATTMVKALSESGLVEYEPYAGVTLTAAGEKLAALVVRRHRVIEVFLVEVMGYGWDEVHDEAEQLEHVVSERLIDRMDEMAGRPEVDPHGDPIPGPDGIVKPQEVQNLLTCPLHTPVTVTRVIDQDKGFLRFIENHNLKPGESIEVEDRNAASDSVSVRSHDDRHVTIGTRAASKLLVHVPLGLLLLLTAAMPALAQAPPFEIVDNSFLVEEAFNQEAGVFQNIVNLHVLEKGGWETTFTQEWPLFTQTHQFSYTLSYASAGGASAPLQIHYRLQAVQESASRPAFSPRVTLLLPSGSSANDLDGGGYGWQVNLPVSKQFGDTYVHWNAGFTHTPSDRDGDADHNLLTPHAALSGIWRLRPMLNLMLESVIEWEEVVDAGAERRETVVTLSPGVRTGWNTGDTQTIVGLAIPMAFSEGPTDVGVFSYFSYELPFARRP